MVILELVDRTAGGLSNLCGEAAFKLAVSKENPSGFSAQRRCAIKCSPRHVQLKRWLPKVGLYDAMRLSINSWRNLEEALVGIMVSTGSWAAGGSQHRSRTS